MEKKKNLKAKIIYEGKQRKKTPILTILIAVVIIAVLATGYLSQWTYHFGGEEKNDIILVSVNGESITQTQLDEQWDSLPIVAKMQMTKDQLLEELVQETLLLQEAKKQKVIVSDAEVEQFINMQLSQMGMTYTQFEEALASQGTTADEMKSIYKKQLTVAKLFDKTIDNTLNASEEEILDYYNKNKESFYRDPQVRVRHILVAIDNKTMNETQAQERVDLILKKLESNNNSNFCEMVQNYSTDFGSVNNCGEYTFGRGQMVPEFEDASYDMKVGEVRVVKSSYGFHIIIKDADIPEGYITLNESISGVEGGQTLAQGIEQVIIEGKAQEVFDTYVNELTEKSEITYFNPLDDNSSTENIKTTKKSAELENENITESKEDLNQETPLESDENVNTAENNQSNPAES
ncbi:peptidylprolyl isomerase [Candidatus Woesearchaeota archaeon]|nr:peptidylprolyl isomerase [Candidatus Woesearchaeota archaeon]